MASNTTVCEKKKKLKKCSVDLLSPFYDHVLSQCKPYLPDSIGCKNIANITDLTLSSLLCGGFSNSVFDA